MRQVDFKELVKEHELEFFKGLTALNIQPPTLITRVTEHIPEVINFVSKIIDKGQAYVVEDGELKTSFSQEVLIFIIQPVFISR